MSRQISLNIVLEFAFAMGVRHAELDALRKGEIKQLRDELEGLKETRHEAQVSRQENLLEAARRTRERRTAQTLTGLERIGQDPCPDCNRVGWCKCPRMVTGESSE